MIPGGSAAVTRAMIIAQSLGYTEVHLWGADSSFEEGDTHIRKSTTEERIMPLLCAGRVFQTSPWMAVQANDFKALLPMLRDRLGLEIVVHGDGLLPHVARWMGCKTDLENSLQKFLREWRFKFRNVWATH